jgi:hypothetical protein
MNIQEVVLEISARIDAGEAVSNNEILLIVQFLRVILEKYRESGKDLQEANIRNETLIGKLSEAEIKFSVSEKQNNELWSINRTLKEQLLSERPDLREIEALEDQIDSLWGIWNDAGRGRYVKLG